MKRLREFSPLRIKPLRMERRLNGGTEEMNRGRAVRREADLRATMSERLARVHLLCKQMSAIKGAARAR